MPQHCQAKRFKCRALEFGLKCLCVCVCHLRGSFLKGVCLLRL